MIKPRRVAYKAKGMRDDSPANIIHLIQDNKNITTFCGMKAKGRKWVIDYDLNLEVNCQKCLAFAEKKKRREEDAHSS